MTRSLTRFPVEEIRAELASALGLRKTSVEVCINQAKPYDVTLKAVARKVSATAVNRIGEMIRVHQLSDSNITASEDGVVVILSRQVEICVEEGCR